MLGVLLMCVGVSWRCVCGLYVGGGLVGECGCGLGDTLNCVSY